MLFLITSIWLMFFYNSTLIEFLPLCLDEQTDIDNARSWVGLPLILNVALLFHSSVLVV